MGKSVKTATKLAAEKAALIKEESNKNESKPSDMVQKEMIAEHLPPLALVFTVLACSGILWVFAFRDVFSTGRNIAGSLDEAMLVSQFKLRIYGVVSFQVSLASSNIFFFHRFRCLQNLPTFSGMQRDGSRPREV
jgi:hypothetical protein